MGTLECTTNIYLCACSKCTGTYVLCLMSPQNVVVTPSTRGGSKGVLTGTPKQRANTKTISFEVGVRVCRMASLLFVL